MACPYAHHLRYIQRLEPKSKSRPLTFGSDFHKLLQYRHSPSDLSKTMEGIKLDYENLTSEELNQVGDTYLEELFTIFDDYVRYWKEDIGSPATEFNFGVPIGKYKGEEVAFVGVVDEEQGDILLEHKTFSRMPNMSLLAMNRQPCLYAKARELAWGKKYSRVRWDYIKSQPAQQPIWLEKSGRFSEAKNNSITPYSWLRACDEHEIVDKATRKKAKLYKQNLSNFFFRCDIELLPSMVEAVWRDYKEVARQIVTKGGNNTVKNIGDRCTWCDYRPICYAEFTGANTEHIKETDFQTKEVRK